MPVALAQELSSTKPQEDGTKAIIAYASRSLSKAESHYPAHKLGVSCPQVVSGQEIP